MPLFVFADRADATVLGPVADQLAKLGVGKMYSWDEISVKGVEVGGVWGKADIQHLNFNKLSVSASSVEAVKRGDGFNGIVHPESDALVLFTSGWVVAVAY